jgi:hypothetical protein
VGNLERDGSLERDKPIFKSEDLEGQRAKWLLVRALVKPVKG